MPLINVVRRAETLQAYQLTSSDDMYTALEFLSTKGYGGHINCTPDGQTWTLGITDSVTSQSAALGDWIVIKNGAHAEVVPQAQAGALYQPA